MDADRQYERREKAARLLALVAEPAILRLCLEYPEWGCDRLAHYLTLTWRSVSSPSVQKILIRNGLGRMAQRMAERDRRRGG